MEYGARITAIVMLALMIVGIYTIASYVYRKMIKKPEYEPIIWDHGVFDDFKKSNKRTTLQKYCNHNSMKEFDLPIGIGIEFTARQNR